MCCSVDCGVDAFDCCWFVLFWIGGYGCEFGVGAWGLVGRLASWVCWVWVVGFGGGLCM